MSDVLSLALHNLTPPSSCSSRWALLDAEGAPKLADFGAAREARPDATMRAGSLGTLAYLAPEQVRGEAGDARADIYAAGILFHELLTGERPIPTEGRDDFLLRRAILNEAPTLDLPAEAAQLTPLLTRALAKDPQARFADARAMREALAEVIDGGASAVLTTPTTGDRPEASVGTA